MIVTLDSHSPAIGNNVFIAPDAWVIGDVHLGENVSVFFGAVLRGDLMPIRVGNGTNIQEHAVIHTTHKRSPAELGELVTVGHRAIIHGAKIGNRCLIGMGAIVLDDTVVGDDSLIAAGCVLSESKNIPPRSLVMGTPGKVVRSLTQEEVDTLTDGANRYIEFGKMYGRMFPDRKHA